MKNYIEQLNKSSEVKDENDDKVQRVMLKNIKNINSLINQQKESEIKQITVFNVV